MWSTLSWPSYSCVVVSLIPPRLHLGHTPGEPRRMEYELLVGGRLCVSWDVPSEFVLPTFLPAQQFFSASFVLSPLLWRVWSHQWGLNCCHPTQLNHLVSNGGFPPYPSLWGMGAWRVYGSFQLTGLWGVFARLTGEVKEEHVGFFTQTFTPNFKQENSLFYNPSLLLVVFPITTISDSVFLTDVTVENVYTRSLKHIYYRVLSIVVEQESQTTNKMNHLVGSKNQTLLCV